MGFHGEMTEDHAVTTAVLLDIDGTLVDSNYLHVDAWARAFAACGRPVDAARIHRAIGMDSSKLLTHLVGDDAHTIADELKEKHSAFYKQLTDRLRRFEGVQELVQELSRRGHTVVLATSAPQDELEILLDVLALGDAVNAVTSSDDVATAKPEPDIFDVALEKVGATRERAVVVGDSVWDIEAAERAGVRSIGVLSGGFSRDELRSAGADVVYTDIAELLRQLDESPLSRLRDSSSSN